MKRKTWDSYITPYLFFLTILLDNSESDIERLHIKLNVAYIIKNLITSDII